MWTVRIGPRVISQPPQPPSTRSISLNLSNEDDEKRVRKNTLKYDPSSQPTQHKRQKIDQQATTSKKTNASNILSKNPTSSIGKKSSNKKVSSSVRTSTSTKPVYTRPLVNATKKLKPLNSVSVVKSDFEKSWDMERNMFLQRQRPIDDTSGAYGDINQNKLDAAVLDSKILKEKKIIELETLAEEKKINASISVHEYQCIKEKSLISAKYSEMERDALFEEQRFKRAVQMRHLDEDRAFNFEKQRQNMSLQNSSHASTLRINELSAAREHEKDILNIHLFKKSRREKSPYENDNIDSDDYAGDSEEEFNESDDDLPSPYTN